MPNLSKLEIAQAAAKTVQQAKVAVQVRRNEIREVKAEASQVFALAQAGPFVEGAAAARIRLQQVEADLPEMTSGIPELEAQLELNIQQARAAGMGLYEETEQLLQQIEARLRQEILPLVNLLQSHRVALSGCYCPLPGKNMGRHDPYNQLPEYLDNLQGQLSFIESKSKVLARG